jgi:BirA family biotin operon repressor/biotin-[acetyl-CoA-carboxylase] ligase
MVWRVEHFEEIDSTNKWLVQRARDGSAEGHVAMANFQSNGRGRLDRHWESPPGASLLCSVLLRPDIDAGQLQLVVAAVALALRAALVRLCGVRPALKWPNDLVVDDAKLAGLLGEVVITPSGTAVVVGFGVNLTSSPSIVNSTSVLVASGVSLSARGLLDIVLEELESRRERLDNATGREALRAEYEGALATLGQHVRVEGVGEVHVGRARRVDDVGRLVVDVDGEMVAFFAGDVVHLRTVEGAL